MKMIYNGIQRIEGYKKSDGSPFDMCIVYVGVPIEQGSFGKTDKKTRITGYGLKPAEIEGDQGCVSQFEKIAPGALVEFITDQRFFAGSLKTVIVGVKPAASVVSPVRVAS